jgi:L-threonylcarbamoyladenylate synthase
MKTDKIKKAARLLKSGKVIAFPTETVFGIGALLNQPKAIKQIFKIKNRPRNKPLQILIATLQQAKKLGVFDKKSLEFAKEKWPGPYTMVVKKTKLVSKLVTGGSKKVGLRMPAHKVTLALIKKCGPIVATSANRSNQPPARSVKEVKEKTPEIEFIVGGRTKSKKPSKVIDLTRKFKILRA